MAVLGFSHITSEVSDLDKSIGFYQGKGFRLKFKLVMPVYECKFPVLKGVPEEVQLAYMTYADDEACNLELIQHNSRVVNQKEEGEHLSLVFFTNKIEESVTINDLDGNRLSLFKSDGNNCSRHYILPVADLDESLRFYGKFSMKIDDRVEFRSFLGEGKAHSLTFERCLHPHWKGYLHLVYQPDFKPGKRFINSLGFHSFCFLVSNAQKDIYDLLGTQNVFGPIQETKEVNGKQVGFKVGFFGDPSGFPIEYLELV